MVVGSFARLLLTASIHLVNGVPDLTADRANGSTRPLARGLVGAAGAGRVAWALAIAGVGLAATTGTLALVLCAVGMVALGWAYSVGPRPLKCSVAGTALASAGGGLLTYLALRTRDGGPQLRVRRPYRAFVVAQYAVNPALLLSVLG